MLKIAVFSDTHERASDWLDAVRHCAPNAVVHCGDGWRDAQKLRKKFPCLPIFAVGGNCDFDSRAPSSLVFVLEGTRFFVTHGHLYGVKSWGLDRLVYAAQEAEAQICFYGHTHTPDARRIAGIQIFNPGSAGYGRPRTWGLLEISSDGMLQWHLRTLPG